MRPDAPTPERPDFYPRPPRGGRPKYFLGQSQQAQDFYPRPPRGGRLWGVDSDNGRTGFLSTPSARRATPASPAMDGPVVFLSTPSARRATKDDRLKERLILFLSTPSARRATTTIYGGGRKP